MPPTILLVAIKVDLVGDDAEVHFAGMVRPRSKFQLAPEGGGGGEGGGEGGGVGGGVGVEEGVEGGWSGWWSGDWKGVWVDGGG